MLILSGSSTSAQTWAEWFKQKKTQQKYLIQQIAGLQVYIEFAKKGYELTTKGLNTVRAIKSGDFNLHNDFFKGLGQVNLNVKNTYQSLLVVFLFQQIIKIGNNLNSNAKNTHLLLPDEMGYLQSVIENLKDD